MFNIKFSYFQLNFHIFIAPTALPLFLPLVPQALWAGCRWHGGHIQVLRFACLCCSCTFCCGDLHIWRIYYIMLVVGAMGVIFRWSRLWRLIFFMLFVLFMVVFLARSPSLKITINHSTLFSFLWIIVHIYVLTQIKDDGDLRMQRSAMIFQLRTWFNSWFSFYTSGLSDFLVPDIWTSWWACQCWSPWSPSSTGQCQGRKPHSPFS